MKKLLIVEDNQDMRRELQQFLQRSGFDVRAVASCEDGIDEVDENTYDAAVIDINLPGKSGFELVEYIREQGQAMPLLAMTARDAIDDKLKGFDLGLTDYIVKPFDLQEMLARLQVHVGATADDDAPIKTDTFELRPKSFEFFARGKAIELTQLELRIMRTLMANNHTLVSLDQLITDAWGETPDMVNPPIRIHIANLRKKIGDDSFTIIRTIPGTGYIFNDPEPAR